MMIEKKNIFYLKKKVIFPFCTHSLLIKKSDTSLALKIHDQILAFPIKTVADILLPGKKIATLCEIIEIEGKDEKLRLKLKGIERVLIKKINRLQLADYKKIDIEEPEKIKEMKDVLIKKAQELIFLINVSESDRLIALVNYLQNTSQAVDFIANYFILDFKKRIRIYWQLDIEKRLNMVMTDIEKLIQEYMIKQDGKI